MQTRVFILIFLFLPAFLFCQTAIDSTARVLPTISASQTAYTWLSSATYIVIDSATAASIRAATYQRQKVQRDTAKAIMISRDSIYQDHRLIGYFHFIRGMDITEIYSTTGFIRASAKNTRDKNWHITYLGNGSQQDMISTGFFEEDIAVFLVKQGYL